MIRLYTWTTPNGRKASIALEELELRYSVNAIDIGDDEQFSAKFAAMSPYNKIPVIVDEDAGDLEVFESGAILVYLAEKAGRLLPSVGAERYRTLSWLQLQVGGVGPMFGQLEHFVAAEEQNKGAIKRYVGQVERLLNVLEKRLETSTHLAGDEFSIADIAAYPWVKAAVDNFSKVLPSPPLDSREDLARWMERVGARPSVQRGMNVPESN